MHALIQGLLQWYFGILGQFGLLGVVVLMAMESSIFPVPSELVVPPAAYLESHVKGGALPLTLLVILAGTVGSFIGASVTYWISRWIGRPLIVKYGKYILIPEHKLRVAERWVAQYGASGIFFARLLPVVRHLISIPAGLADLRFRTFAIMTFLGSAIWCTVLTIFGLVMAHDMAMVVREGINLESAGYKHAFQNLTLGTIGLVAVMGILYALVIRRQHAPTAEEPMPTER
ncbi:MAG TPA: DedA family protein [Armatimonadota bacterium]